MRAAIYLAASLAWAPIGAHAGTIDTLADLFGGASLTIDHFDVHGWTLNQNVSDRSIDYAKIIVDIESSFEGFTLNYDFGGQMSMGATGSIYNDFSYVVTDLARPHFVENVLELSNPVFGNTGQASGSILVTEDVFCGGPPGGYLVGQKRAEIDPGAGVNNPRDSARFLCKDDLWIEKNIQIVSAGSLVSLSDMHQTFVPVPATAALLALGLLGIRWTGRRGA